MEEKSVDLDKQLEETQKFLSLFNIEALINQSALFKIKVRPLEEDFFKPITRKKFSTKYMNFIKELLTNETYDQYNSHIWEYSQINKISYQVNGQRARNMFTKSIARNPQQLKMLYKESCIDTNIPLFRATINQQIQDACFKNKDKYLISCLYKQMEQPSIYISKVLRILELNCVTEGD